MPKASARANGARPYTTTRSSAEPVSVPQNKAKAIAKVHNGGITRDLVEAKAYELWQARGGDALVNWLEAEAIVNAHATPRV